MLEVLGGSEFAALVRREAPRADLAAIARTHDRAYIDAVSFTSAGDHSRSAMAAVAGQMRESTVSMEVYSFHMQASPPTARSVCAGLL